MAQILTGGLVAGRHSMPCTEFIWDGEVADPMNHKALVEHVATKISADTDMVRLYITGLTPCLLAVVDYCNWHGISLVALQYDRDTDRYTENHIIDFKRCPFCKKPMLHYAWAWYCPHCGST